MSRRPRLVSPVWGPARIMCSRPPKSCSRPCSCWPVNRSAVITIWTISRRGFCRLSAIRRAGRGRAHAFGLGHRLPLPWPRGRAGAIAQNRRTGTNDPYVEGIRRRGWRPHQPGKMTVEVETGGHGPAQNAGAPDLADEARILLCDLGVLRVLCVKSGRRTTNKPMGNSMPGGARERETTQGANK
jgi:hypothetical protein